MQQHLDIKRLVVIVGDNQAGGQALAGEGDAVDGVEGIGPLALGGIVEAGRTKAKVKLYREISGRRRGGGRRLRSRLAQKLPTRVAREAMLGQLGGLFVVWSGAEDLFKKSSSVYPSHPVSLSAEGQVKLTGNTSGIPPRTALDPSSLAASLNHSFSSPFLSFQLMTVAP